MKFFGWHVRSPGQKAHCWVRMDDGDMVTLCGRRTQGAHLPDEEAERCSRCIRAYNDISVYLVARRVGYEDVLAAHPEVTAEDLMRAMDTPQDVQRTEV